MPLRQLITVGESPEAFLPVWQWAFRFFANLSILMHQIANIYAYNNTYVTILSIRKFCLL